MKIKTQKIIFWIVTILFAGVNLFSGISELMQTPSSLGVMQFLGYPAYFLIILGIAKILGSLAILQQKYNTLKEWAYAGFTIDYLSAFASFAFVSGFTTELIIPIIFIGFLALSYWLCKKTGGKK